MTGRDEHIHVRPGRIRHANQGDRRPKSFVGKAMRASKKAGHLGRNFGRTSAGPIRSRFGRGRRAALSLSLQSTSRRVVMKARVVRHSSTRFRSAPLPKHIAYLKREGVTWDNTGAGMFDAQSDTADERAFAERCDEDRHHVHAGADGWCERDLDTGLDWVAADHCNRQPSRSRPTARGRPRKSRISWSAAPIQPRLP
jgi:hypothetical protein